MRLLARPHALYHPALPSIPSALPRAYLVFKILAQIHSEHISIYRVLRRILSDGSKTNAFGKHPEE